MLRLRGVCQKTLGGALHVEWGIRIVKAAVSRFMGGPTAALSPLWHRFPGVGV